MFDCLILLAGKGERTGLEYNKVFYRIKDKPLFRLALETFLKVPLCRKVVLACREEEISAVKAMVSDLSKIEFVVGGKYRQDSVKAGMEKCSSEVVLIHDGARPFIEREEIEKIYQATIRSKAAVLAVRSADTIVEVKDGYRTLERQYLWKVLTPQGVLRKLYLEAVSLAEKEAYYGTDDVGLLERYLKINPEIVPGKDKNIKITTERDLLYLEFLSRRDV